MCLKPVYDGEKAIELNVLVVINGPIRIVLVLVTMTIRTFVLKRNLTSSVQHVCLISCLILVFLLPILVIVILTWNVLLDNLQIPHLLLLMTRNK